MRSYTAIVAAAVLTIGMMIGAAGTVLADSEGAGVRGTTEISQWTTVGAPGNSQLQAEAWPMRGPMETGALPPQSVKPEGSRSLNMDVAAQNWSPELRGRANIQAGP